jgi:hypothetical protein
VARRQSRFALLALIALVVAGCGSSSSTPNAALVPTAVTTTPSPVTTASTPTTPTTEIGPTTTADDTTSTPSTTTTVPVTGPGPPAPPLGLSAATGYASYDDCQGTCTGSVPSSLRRPLDLPSLDAGGACPASGAASAASYAGPAVGPGPVYVAQASPLAVSKFIDSAWDGAQVTWVAASSYTGPLLIRGGELGGAGSVGFGEGHVPEDELQLLTAATTSPGEPPGAREWPSFTRVGASGCYAYQVDGTSFSEVIAFSVPSSP